MGQQHFLTTIHFQLSMQIMALGANSPGLWQSQLAAVAARQLSQNNESRGATTGLPVPGLPPPPPLTSLQSPPNEIQAIQQALQQQQQNIQQHLQNLLLLQQSANSLGSMGANNNAPPSFMGNQVVLSFRLSSLSFTEFTESS